MYYKFSYIIDEKQHRYPQVDCITSMIVNFLSEWKINDISAYPVLKYELKRGAKPTDLLSSTAGSSTDLLTSPRLLKVLQQFKLPYYQVLKSTVSTKNKTYDYNLLHFYGRPLADCINYKESVFYEWEWVIRRVGPIKLESFDHYLALKKLDTKASFGVGYDKIVLNEDFNLDLFYIFPFGHEVYVTEELRARLIAENITGITLEETDKVIKP